MPFPVGKKSWIGSILFLMHCYLESREQVDPFSRESPLRDSLLYKGSSAPSQSHPISLTPIFNFLQYCVHHKSCRLAGTNVFTVVLAIFMSV